MKVPTCKLCGKAHWSYEDHYTGTSAINPDYVREMAAGAMGLSEGAKARDAEVPNIGTMGDAAPFVDHLSPQIVPTPPPDVPTDVPTTECECGKPREGRYKSCTACRKRAYRERSK